MWIKDVCDGCGEKIWEMEEGYWPGLSDEVTKNITEHLTYCKVCAEKMDYVCPVSSAKIVPRDIMEIYQDVINKVDE